MTAPASPERTLHSPYCTDEGLHARAERAEAQVAALVAALRALHKPLRIYDECDHEHDQDEPGLIDTGEYLTCEATFMYSICRECCSDDGEQTEDCSTYHDHVQDGLCATSALLDRHAPDSAS